jgi:hypothetical protein
VFILTALTGGFVTASHSAESRPARLQKHTSEAFDQILRENALFFNLLVTFSFTLAVAEPEWGVGVNNINVNLITRALRDPRGHQLVRVRVAGVVRKNHNVELDLLNNAGALVGKAFFGYSSGQITFFESAGLTLQPLERHAALLSQLFEDSSYTRLNGYIEVTASEPIAATVLYGDSTSRFLSAVPGIPR